MIDRPRLPPAQKEVGPRRQNKLVALPLISSPSWDWSPLAWGGSELERALKGTSDPLSLRPSPAGQCGCVTLGNHIPSLSPGCNLLGSLEDHMVIDLQGLLAVSVALQIGRWLLQATPEAATTDLKPLCQQSRANRRREPFRFQPGSQMHLLRFPKGSSQISAQRPQTHFRISGRNRSLYKQTDFLVRGHCKYHLQKEVNQNFPC